MRTVPFGTLASFANGLNFSVRQEGRGLPILKVKDFAKGHYFSDAGLDHVDPDKVRVGSKHLLQEGDIVLVRSNGNPALVARASMFLGATCPVSFSGFCIRVRVDRAQADPRFVLYALRSPLVRTWLVSHGSGTSIQNVTQESLAGLRFPLPLLTEQRRIADTLGALDDKVELIRRINRTLESIARAIFKSWFVDFDPVRRKMAGETGGELGLPPSLAASFPSRLVVSDGRHIPEGWQLVRLATQVRVDRGLSYTGAGLSDAGIPMHNLNSILEGGGFKPVGLKFYTGAHDDRHTVEPGDILVANTEQGHERRLIGYCCLAPDPGPPRAIFSHHLFRVRLLASSTLTPEFLAYSLNSPRMQAEVSGYATGTTVNTLPADALARPVVLLPPRDLVAAFSMLAAGSHSMQKVLQCSTTTLEQIRESLLPRLLSEAGVVQSEVETAAGARPDNGR